MWLWVFGRCNHTANLLFNGQSGASAQGPQRQSFKKVPFQYFIIIFFLFLHSGYLCYSVFSLTFLVYFPFSFINVCLHLYYCTFPSVLLFNWLLAVFKHLNNRIELDWIESESQYTSILLTCPVLEFVSYIWAVDLRSSFRILFFFALIRLESYNSGLNVQNIKHCFLKNNFKPRLHYVFLSFTLLLIYIWNWCHI
jgi:hypothetical protein